MTEGVSNTNFFTLDINVAINVSERNTSWANNQKLPQSVSIYLKIPKAAETPNEEQSYEGWSAMW